ncbi:CSEP0480 putative effector protein [Blumeria hordei DH14]|uniref:CSEP0480 putative effector protein n=1 Tax=Blumeria graminis f. sp. hordei (strain DH14) TaxID=546991 RepID=N1JL52_BLUG1|nr:CSEP0480 putative effector protein [Blumeria hordei DH14]
MRVTVNLQSTKFRHFQFILFTVSTLLKLSLQSDVSGYICDDKIVWHEEAQEVAQFATELMTRVDTPFKYPALLEDTQLFGKADQNLFVVPLKNYRSIRVGGRPGSDRVVIDDRGSLVGVVINIRNGIDLRSAYKVCTPFLKYDKLSLGLNEDSTSKISGFACGANFLSSRIETEMKRKCSGLENLSPTNKQFFQYLDRNGITWSENKFWYKHFTKKDYNDQYINKAAVYRVEFTPRCRLIQITPMVRCASPKPACIEIWTPKPTTDMISINPSRNPQHQNQESSEIYRCSDVSFKMINLRMYLTRFYSLHSTTTRTSTEGALIIQNENLHLWPIFPPERPERKLKIRSIYAMGFNEKNVFMGLYFASTRGQLGKVYKPCPNPNLLKFLLADRNLTEGNKDTIDFFH